MEPNKLSDFWRKLWPALLAAVLAALGIAVPVQFQGCAKPPTPPTLPGDPPPPPPPPAADPVKAIGKLAMSGGFCSATVVGPSTAGRPMVLVSAAHCVKRVGEQVTFIPREGGGSYRCTVQSINRQADVCVITFDDVSLRLPFVKVAQQTPPAGSVVLHAGFGVDVPGNVERGQVLAGPDQNGQVRYRLSVSPGDSGGGICMTEGGELLSPVCCTDRLSGVGNVWGGAPEVIRQMIATPTEFIDLPPVAMPPPPALAP